MERKGKRMWEILVLVVIVAAGIAFSAYVVMERGKVDKERQMIGELNALRSGVTLYTMVNKQRPTTLQDLISGTYEAGGSRLPYVVGLKDEVKNSGKFIDPYGNPYSYDTRKGWIYSSTQGYQKW